MEKIVGHINQLHEQNVIDVNSMSIVIGEGSIARFWEDAWCGACFLKRFPTICMLYLF